MAWSNQEIATQQGETIQARVWTDGTGFYQGQRQPDVLAHHIVSSASANAANVKASPGRLRGMSLFNAGAQPAYIKFHNTAGTPTAGSGVVRTYGIQAGQRLDVDIPGGGVVFATGIGRTIVRNPADNDTAAIGANEVTGEVYYE